MDPTVPASRSLSTVRRDAVDVARSVALLVVVLGHLLLAVVDRAGGDVRGANLLALRPEWAFVAALAPMPVFFAAAGWANATATLTASAARLRTLVGLGAVVVTAWSVVVIAVEVITGDSSVVADGARVASQPLWFVAAYVPLAAAGAWLARVAADHLAAALSTTLGGLVLLDAARFWWTAPDWIGWPGFYLAWATPWLLGGWWRAHHQRDNFNERRAGVVALLAGVAVCGALVAFAGYQAGLIDAVPGRRSNTTPPTLYTATAAVAQVGVLMLAADGLDAAGRRWRQLWNRLGEAAVGIYVWHLTGLALCAGIIAAGLPIPRRLTATWWLTRPLWWAAVLAVTSVFVVLTAAGRARLRRGARQLTAGPARVVAGVILAAAAGAAVGLRGPQTPLDAVVDTALFVTAWWLLRPRHASP